MSGLAASLLVVATILSLLGCTLLALSQARNWQSVTGRQLAKTTQSTARRSGWCVVLVALPICIAADGIGFAALTWPLLLAVAAFAVAMALSFRPELLKAAARSCELGARVTGNDATK